MPTLPIRHTPGDFIVTWLKGLGPDTAEGTVVDDGALAGHQIAIISHLYQTTVKIQDGFCFTGT